jgi:autotransporter-associated beta strand protein
MSRRLARHAIVAAGLGVATILALGTTPASAQVMELTEHVWDSTKTGAQSWQVPANWTPAVVPNDPLHTANLSGPLGANLNVNLASGVTIAGIKLGATAAARTTELSGSQITFKNGFTPPTPVGNADFNGDTFVNGSDFLIWQRNLGVTGQTNNNRGDANNDTVVNANDLQIWKDQFGVGSETFTIGAAFVDSVGAAGSTHTISSAIHLDNEQLEFAGASPIALNGNVTYIGDPSNVTTPGISAAAIRVVDPQAVVTLNGNLAFANNDGGESVDFFINNSYRAQGRLIIDGILSGTGDIAIGSLDNGTRLPLSTVELKSSNTFTGSVRAARGNLVLDDDNALGFNGTSYATYRQAGPTNQFGYNILSTNDERVINNPMTIAQWQTFRGEHSLEWAGEISQTNSRGVVNLLPADKKLLLSGRVNIFEEAEASVIRRFEVHGTGKTEITGSIRNLPDDAMNIAENHQLVKRGFGVLVVDVAAGDNNHIGDDVIYMGNWHYANNDSLNVGGGLIRAYGGAIGVDDGVANNATFASMIRPESVGGLQLATGFDENATLDFTGTLANAANMTVAAPESGMTFTGTIIPAAGRYQLGGGTGKLTLPGAQLTGSNSLEVRNGGTVELLGDNTYSGSTTILTKYTSTNDLPAAADSNEDNLSDGTLLYEQVAPTLVVDKLSNGGVPGSIGSASSDASNLLIQGSTLKYVGAGESTNRLFTIGTGGATIDSSGAGALTFSNTGALGRDDAEDREGALDDYSRNPGVLYDFADTSDIIVGMTVDDPDPGTPGNFLGFNAGLPNRLDFSAAAAGVPNATVTGISDSGSELGLNVSTPFIYKLTRIVFGTVPRTLTLAGTNTGNNTLASTIANSAKGGVVNIAKTGDGTWVLTGANTYTGTTRVEDGILLVNGTHTGGGAYTLLAGATLGGTGAIAANITTSGTIAPGAGGAGALTVTGNVTFNAGSTALFQIGGTTAGSFDELNITGALAAGGTLDVDLTGGFVPSVGNSFDLLDFTSLTGSFTLSLPALPSGRVWNTANLLTTGTISVAAGLAAVPEPSAMALAAMGLAALGARRRTKR